MSAVQPARHARRRHCSAYIPFSQPQGFGRQMFSRDLFFDGRAATDGDETPLI
jgi:hypothetical protein